MTVAEKYLRAGLPRRYWFATDVGGVYSAIPELVRLPYSERGIVFEFNDGSRLFMDDIGRKLSVLPDEEVTR